MSRQLLLFPDLQDDPRPSDPPFLLAILIAARKTGDKLLESLARDWLAEQGIHVVFTDQLESTGEANRDR
jgi:Fe-S-cluster formation regulator IscX/YfhJ